MFSNGSKSTERNTQDAISEEKLINEEYKVWKKNSPFLYDLVITHALEWPTLTAQWFPDKEVLPGRNFSTQRLLLGTHTSCADDNYIKIAQVHLPLGTEDIDPRKYDDDKGEIGGYHGQECRVSIVQRIDHKGEVNRARYMPQNPDIIATQAPDANAYVFDRTKHPSEPLGVFAPQMTLKGHTKEGYGLSWNSNKEGQLITGSEDAAVCLWDITSYQKSKTTLTPVTRYTAHTKIVNDVHFHPIHTSLFASVSDDLTLHIHDTRSSDVNKPAHSVEAHTAAVNAVAFNPTSEFVVATSSADRTVGLWDLRNLKMKLHTFEGHEDEVTSLAWSPHDETILGSASVDRRVIIWDLAKIGEEQTPEDAEDGSPELLFMHGGHTNRISDFSWNPQEPWCVASAAEDNIIQIWQPASKIYAEDDDEQGENELEAEGA